MFGKFFPIMTAAVLLAFAPAAAQDNPKEYPNRPVRAIVTVPAGSFTDIVARRIAVSASAVMRQTWIVENRPGANFIAGAEACRHAKPDGYTVCVFTTSTLTFNPFLVENLPYVPERDFTPIILLSMFDGGLVASPTLKVKNIEELRALAVKNSGKFNFGTYGPASSPNVFRHYISELWKTEIVEVPYKGANELVSALKAGEIHMTYSALGTWANDNPNEEKGRVMVQDFPKRSPRLPDAPTYAEAGIDFPITTWVGLFAPAGVPTDIINQINKQVAEAIDKPDVNAWLTERVLAPRITSAKEFEAFIAREREETGKMLRKFNVPKIK